MRWLKAIQMEIFLRKKCKLAEQFYDPPNPHCLSSIKKSQIKGKGETEA